MIVNATFRDQGGLAAHLQRADTNESVVVRDDLSCFCSLEIDDAVADFAAIGVAKGVKKPLIHISVSPERPLSPEQEHEMIARVRAVYGIPPDHPMLVVAHRKPGEFDRPDHYHTVLPSVKSDGRRISDAYYKIKNERISLELEVQFGHRLVPGPNVGSVRRQLEIERPEMAEVIASLEAPVDENDMTTVSDKNFAVASGVDLGAFDARVFSVWEAGGFKDKAQLASGGLAVALGDNGIMVLDAKTGLSQSLLRLLNRESKRRGKPIRLKKAELQKILADLAATSGDLKPTRRLLIFQSVEVARQQASACSFIERQVCGFSSQIDASTTEIEQLTRSQLITAVKGESTPIAGDQDRSVRRPSTIKDDLETMRRLHRERVESRKRDAAHAWKSARIWRSSSLEKFVAAAAAGAVLACGGGLLISIAAAGFASGFVAERGRHERDKAIAASQSLKQTYPEIREETDAYFARVRAADSFDLDLIPTHTRVAAGYVFRRVADGAEPLSAVCDALDAVSPKLAEHIADVAKLATNSRLRRAFGGLYALTEPTAVAELRAFTRRAQKLDAPGQQSPLKPKPHLNLKGSGIGD